MRVFDPIAVAPEVLGLTQFNSATEAARGADVLVVLTEWPQFAEEDALATAQVMNGSAVLDTRRILSASDWSKAVSSFRALGG